MKSNYDKIAEKLMDTPRDHITLSFEEVQGLLREYRELHLAVEELGVDPKTVVARYKARRASGQSYAEVKSVVLRETQVESVKKALSAVLLFHSGSPWDEEKSLEWFRLTGAYEATTKMLCDAVRRVLTLVCSPADRWAPRASETPDLSESPTGRLNVPTAPPMHNMPVPAPMQQSFHSESALQRGTRIHQALEDRLSSIPGEMVVHDSMMVQVRPDKKPWTTEDTIREVQRVQDRRDEVRRKLDAGEITREEARREFPESY